MARTQIASDDFNRANSGDLGANWLSLRPGWATADLTSNTVHAADTSQEQSERWAGSGTFSDDQYSKLTLATGSRGWDTSDYRIGVIVRADSATDAGRDFYALMMLNDADIGVACTTRIVKMLNGTESTLSTTTTTWADGDTISLEVVTSGGNAVLTAYKNDVAISALNVTDSSSPFTTGKPGLYIRGSSTRPVGDNWSGGDVTSGAEAALSGSASTPGHGTASPEISIGL
jgi:hypothetical protein